MSAKVSDQQSRTMKSLEWLLMLVHKSRYVFLMYFLSYWVLVFTGGYHHHGPGNSGGTFWVWTPAFTTWEYQGKGSIMGDVDLPTWVGEVYLPLLYLDNHFFREYHHPTLIASTMKGDGETFEYPDKGLTFADTPTVPY